MAIAAASARNFVQSERPLFAWIPKYEGGFVRNGVCWRSRGGGHVGARERVRGRLEERLAERALVFCHVKKKTNAPR